MWFREKKFTFVAGRNKQSVYVVQVTHCLVLDEDAQSADPVQLNTAAAFRGGFAHFTLDEQQSWADGLKFL